MMDRDKKKDLAFEPQAEIFKVLTHPARLAILEILRDGEHCVCHMEAWLGYRQAYISQQLSVLKQAGLISDRRDGWNIYYQVADERIYALLDIACRMTGFDALKIKEPATPCACPKCSIAASVPSGKNKILEVNRIQ